jgi:hypothetical protein
MTASDPALGGVEFIPSEWKGGFAWNTSLIFFHFHANLALYAHLSSFYLISIRSHLFSYKTSRNNLHQYINYTKLPENDFSIRLKWRGNVRKM